MSIEEFRNNDAGYLAWLAANRAGYVLNIQRDHNARDARLHRAACRTINGVPARGRTWTGGPYIKVCALDQSTLATWNSEQTGGPITPCGHCRP